MTGGSDKFRRWIDSPTFSTGIRIASFLCMIGLLVIGWQMRKTIPDIPMVDDDVRGYLHPALNWLGNGVFLQTDGRQWLYPALITAIFKWGGSFTSLVIFQQVAGLFGAIVLWIAFSHWLSVYAEKNNIILLSGHIVNVIVVALYVLNPHIIFFEKSIRPELLMVVFALCYILGIIGFFDNRWRNPRLIPAILYGILAITGSYLVYVLKPSWTLTFPASILPLLIALWGKENKWLRFLPLGFGVLSVIVLFLGPKFLGFQPTFHAKSFLPLTLVSIHADAIVEDGKHRLATPSEMKEMSPADAEILSKFTSHLDTALINSKKIPTPYPVLGFEADKIMYEADVFKVTYDPTWKAADLYNYCYRAYLHAWLGQPRMMARKIWRQARFFLSPPDADYYYDDTKRRADRAWLETAKALSHLGVPIVPATKELYGNYQRDVEEVTQQKHTLRLPRILVTLGTILRHTHLWIQLFFFIALLVVLRDARNTSHTAKISGLCLLSILPGMYAYILTIAIVHTLDSARYRTSFIAFFMPLLLMMLIYSIFTFLRIFLPKYFGSCTTGEASAS